MSLSMFAPLLNYTSGPQFFFSNLKLHSHLFSNFYIFPNYFPSSFSSHNQHSLQTPLTPTPTSSLVNLRLTPSPTTTFPTNPIRISIFISPHKTTQLISIFILAPPIKIQSSPYSNSSLSSAINFFNLHLLMYKPTSTSFSISPENPHEPNLPISHAKHHFRQISKPPHCYRC